VQVREPERRTQRPRLHRDGIEALLGEADQIHLVDRHDNVANAQERRDLSMPASLHDDAGAGVDQHDRQVRRRGSGEHVAGVALVAGGVGKDERPAWRREVPVGHVDRDPLLALGAQAVGDRRQVKRAVAPGHRGQLVRHQQPGVEQQPADQGRLAIVHRAGRREPQ